MSSKDQSSGTCAAVGDVRVHIGSRINLLFEYPAMYLILLSKHLVVWCRIRDMVADGDHVYVVASAAFLVPLADFELTN